MTDSPIGAPAQPETAPTLPVGAAITRVTTAVGERVLELRAATGLSGIQLQTVRLGLDGISMNGLAERLKAPKSTITSVVDQLVADGLVERATDAADRRRQIVTATRAGVALLERFDAALGVRIAELIEALPEAQRQRLGVLLSKLPDPTMPVPLA